MSAWAPSYVVVVVAALIGASAGEARVLSSTERANAPLLLAQVDDESAPPDDIAPDEEVLPPSSESVSDDEVGRRERAATSSSDAPVGDPPPPVGAAPPALVDETVDDDARMLPPPDARASDDAAQGAPSSRREQRARAEPDALDILFGGAAGGLGGTAGGGLAMLSSALMAVVGLTGFVMLSTAAIATGGGPSPLLFVGAGVSILGFTLASILFILSPAIAAVVAGMAMLLFAVDAQEGDWLMLGACAAGIALAILTFVFVLLSASVGVVFDPCGAAYPFATMGPEGPSFTPRFALTSTMFGTALGGLVGSLVFGSAAFAILPVLAPALGGSGVSFADASLLALAGVVVGLPVGLVVGSAIGGGIGGAIGVALEE